MKELVISYMEAGLTIADVKAVKWAEELAEIFNKGTVSALRVVSNAAMVDAVRLLIAKGVLNHEEVVFRYEGKNIKPNRYGMIVHWPDGFCDSHDNILGDLLTASVKTRKTRR